MDENLIVMEFEAKFYLNSPNLSSVLKQIEQQGLTGKRKADIFLRCASVIFLSDTTEKPQYRKCMCSSEREIISLFFFSLVCLSLLNLSGLRTLSNLSIELSCERGLR